jgi:glutathione S-transferase
VRPVAALLRRGAKSSEIGARGPTYRRGNGAVRPAGLFGHDHQKEDTVIKLLGFPVSNYVNMVHYTLLEKGIPFEYVLTFPDQSPEFLAKSPRGKVPVLETPQGCLNEASVILEYLEETGSGKPLLPREPHARAYVRSLMKEIELYIELPARSCFVEAFFGGRLSQSIKERAREDLAAGFAALRRHAKFAPFVTGSQFTLADVVFLYSVDLAATVSKLMFGIEPLADWPQAQALLQRLGESPHVQMIARSREAARPAFVEAVKARLAAAAALAQGG